VGRVGLGLDQREPAAVRAAREVWEGDLESSTYHRDHHRPPTLGCPGPLRLLLGFDTARERVRAVAGGESQPESVYGRRISPAESDFTLHL
jgi:hypothetical protein